MSGVQYFEVTSEEDGQRIDNYLSSRLKGAPKSLLYRIIRKGEVRVNKGRVKPESKLREGDMVRVPPIRLSEQKLPPKPSFQFEKQLSDAKLYDKDGLCILNKPSGLAVHGGSGINLGLIEALRYSERAPKFLELVHRLDRDTSGCIMIARKRSMLKFLQEGLRQRGVIQKTYQLLVSGHWPQNVSVVNAPLLRRQLPNGERVVRVDTDGKESLTEFRVLARYQESTLLEAKPLTGRTHQIRVHALHVGCALVGDDKYGNGDDNLRYRQKGFKRLFLHASSLSLMLPSGDRLFVEAKLPLELQKPLKRLQ